jgi:hypothetical protein
MRSPTDPRDPRDEPGEIVEAFRGAPPVRLDPAAGAFHALRRRAAARRRRRAFAAATGVAACLGGITTVVALTVPGDAGSPTTPPAAHGSSSPAARTPSGDPPTTDASAPSDPAESPPQSPEPTGDSGGTTPTCATAQLDLTSGTPNSGAGSVFVPLEFTNRGEDACAMLGYPGVSLVGEDASGQVGAPARRGTERGEAVVLELPPGASATADLRITRAENYPAEDCDPTATRGLRVYPPNQRASLFLPYENVTGCANEDVELLSVTVVYAGE